MREEIPNPYQAPSTLDNEVMVSHPLLDGRLKTVAFGLKLIYWGILLMLIIWMGMIPISMISFQVSGIQWMLAGVVLLSAGMINIGPLLCLTVPRGYGLRPWAIATLLAQLLVIGSFVLQAFLMGIPVVSGIWIVFALAGLVFLGFLHRLARVIDRSDLVFRCRSVLAFAGFLVLVGIGLVIFMTTTSPGMGLSMLLPLTLFVLVLVLVVFYASVVNSIANAIQSPLRGNVNPSIV